MKACIISAKAARCFMQNIFLPQEIFGKAYKKRCWLFASETYISSVFLSLYLEKCSLFCWWWCLFFFVFFSGSEDGSLCLSNQHENITAFYFSSAVLTLCIPSSFTQTLWKSCLNILLRVKAKNLTAPNCILWPISSRISVASSWIISGDSPISFANWRENKQKSSQMWFLSPCPCTPFNVPQQLWQH